MKARVYGWACDPTNDFRTFFFGDIKDVLKHDEWHGFKFKHNSNEYIVHEKQIEQIREITITEEDFYNAIEKSQSENADGSSYINPEYLKRVLFKDVK